MNSIWAVVPAAGSSRRLGGEIPKQYREIAGVPLLEHTLRALLESPEIRGIVVALDPSDRRADAIDSSGRCASADLAGWRGARTFRDGRPAMAVSAGQQG